MRFPVHPARARTDAAASRSTLPVAKALRYLGKTLQAEDGFTIIEVIVATVVLVIGLLTAFLALNTSLHSSSNVRERENGVALARQITEDARSIPYSQLSPDTITSTLQGYPGLANTGTGSTWTIKRAGYPYTITDDLTVPNSGATDIKQFTVTVTWASFQHQSHTYSESAIMTRAGQDPGLQAKDPCLVTTGAGITGPPDSPDCNNDAVVASAIPSLQFSVMAPAGTSAVVWTLNGAKQDSWSASAPSSGTTWTSNSWSLSGVSDGTYTIGAAAEDSSGIDGPSVTMTVRLIRNVPTAPTVTGYGFNSKLPGDSSNAAEFQWNSNPENNIVGYSLYHDNPDGSLTLICQTSLSTSYQTCPGNSNAWCLSTTQCIDLSPPATSSSYLTYTVRALYYDANNNIQEGAGQDVTLASGAPTVATPASATLAVQVQPDDSAILTWAPSTGSVSFYRIYRDGESYTDRYDTVSASSCTTACTYHDTNRSTQHSYYITAVGGTTPGADMAESAPLALGTG